MKNWDEHQTPPPVIISDNSTNSSSRVSMEVAQPINRGMRSWWDMYIIPEVACTVPVAVNTVDFTCNPISTVVVKKRQTRRLSRK